MKFKLLSFAHLNIFYGMFELWSGFFPCFDKVLTITVYLCATVAIFCNLTCKAAEK